MKKPFDITAEYQPKSFTFKDKKAVKNILAEYPPEGKRSATMPLLYLAQSQVANEGKKASPPYGGWISRAAMDEIATIVGVDNVRVYEVATFYSMYNLAPVGKFLVQLCTTTPCWLGGSADIVKACEEHLGIKIGQTTSDNLFTLVEVECLGACVNAPMMQVNDDYYEDLTADSVKEVLIALKEGKAVPVGSQSGRTCSMSCKGPTTLDKQAKKCKVL